MDKHLFHRRAGLCNRIRGLVTLMRTETPFSVYEQRTAIFPGQFSDFLDNKIEHHEKPEGYLISWRLQVETDEVPMDFSIVSKDERFPTIDLEYNRVPQHIREKFLPYFNKLQWKKEIVEDVDKIIKDLELVDFTSVHIREDSDWRASGRETDLQRYWDVVDAHIQPKMFFVVHNKEMEDAVVARYGDKAVFRPNRSYTAKDSSCLIEWVKDLLIMSRSKVIIGHYASSFDETAWWIGGCKAEAYMLSKKWNDRKHSLLI